jgi:hypothetical protein
MLAHGEGDPAPEPARGALPRPGARVTVGAVDPGLPLHLARAYPAGRRVDEPRPLESPTGRRVPIPPADAQAN